MITKTDSEASLNGRPFVPRLAVQLLFDEAVSARVARALAELGFRVSHVGGPGQPARGCDDATVIAAARRSNQVIVTSNADMVVLCAEEGESVIWLDPRDRDITFEAQTFLFLRQLRDWDREVRNAAGPVCIQAQKTACRVMSLGEAARIARLRGRRQDQESFTEANAESVRVLDLDAGDWLRVLHPRERHWSSSVG
jgi:predicted nuclease of predicted toxin-antitoxin system